jgi:hypothetical protein
MLQALIAVISLCIIILGWLLAAILSAVKDVARDLKDHLKQDSEIQKALAIAQTRQDLDIEHLKDGMKHLIRINELDNGFVH